jgi:hypothetical protein
MTHHNLILIKGGAFLQVKKAHRQWIDLYADVCTDNVANNSIHFYSSFFLVPS